MSQNQYYRAGAGSVIYNEVGQIALFARSDNPSVWQLQQGGMDAGETNEETLWRELLEETALEVTDIEQVTKYPDWLLYEYPSALRPKLKNPNCLGQTHVWYFLKLKPGVTIDLKNAKDKEFSSVKWESFDHLLSLPDTMKHRVYTTLAQYFKEQLLP